MFFSATARRNLLAKRKYSILTNKISFYTCCSSLDLDNCELAEGSSRYYNYTVAGYLCNWEVSKKYF